MLIKAESRDRVSGRETNLMKTIEEVEKRCIPLDLSCCEVNGKWGIFVLINGRMLLIDEPKDLIASVFKDEQLYLQCIGESKPADADFYVESRIEEGITYQWTLKSVNFPYLTLSGCKDIKITDYQRRVKDAVTHYVEVCKAGKPLHQEREWDMEILQLGLQQMDVTATLPSHYRVTMHDVQVEDFIFEPMEDKQFESCLIGIGNRCFTTWLDHLFCDYETIWHELESIVYEEDGACVRLPFGCLEETVVTFSNAHILKSVDATEAAYAYDYTHLMRVEIESGGSGRPTFLMGYCDCKQAVRSFYECLLKHALLHPKESVSTDDMPSLINLYNMCKSPLLEGYIVGKKRERYVPQTRQQPVREVVIVSPCHNVLGHEAISESSIQVDAATDGIKIAGCTYTLQGATDWLMDYRDIQTALAAGEDAASMDWKRFHERGMALARELRQLLPADIDVWYQSPAADKISAIYTLVI